MEMNSHIRQANSTAGTPRAGRSELPHFFDPRPELSKEAADSQTCLHMWKLLKVSTVTHSIPFHTNHSSGAQESMFKTDYFHHHNGTPGWLL